MLMRRDSAEGTTPVRAAVPRKMRVFIAYSRKDADLCERLAVHLHPLEREQQIELWKDSDLDAGEAWRSRILEWLDKADIVIPLMSPDFMRSEFIQEVELPPVRERLERKAVHVVPVLLRKCAWKNHWLAECNVLPRAGAGVYPVHGRGEDALANVEAEVRALVLKLSSARGAAVENALAPAQSNDRVRFHFRDFDLRVYHDGLRGPCVEVVGQEGERGLSETVHLEEPVMQWAEAVRSGQAREEVCRWLGRLLFDALFPRPIRRLWLQRQQFEDADTYLRLRLDVQDPVLAALPWELMHADRETNLDNYLASSPRRPLTRYVRSDLPEPARAPVNREMKILGVAAGHPGLEWLRARLRTTGASVRLETRATTTADGLRKQLRRGYHVLHYEGAAAVRDDGAALLLPRARGGVEPVTAAALAGLASGGALRLLVLIPPPGSAAQVEGIVGAAREFVAAGVPAVVVMQGAAPRSVVAAFTEAFYTQLEVGLPLELCVSAGRRAILALGAEGGGWALPALFSRVSSGVLWERGGWSSARLARLPEWLVSTRLPRATPAPGARVRIPNNLLRSGPLPVVGRDPRINEVVAALRSGPGTPVVVNLVGEEGSGRSALARAVARRCVDDSAVLGSPDAFESVVWVSARDVVEAPPDGSYAVAQASWTMDDLYLTVGATLDRPRFLGVRPDERLEALEHLLKESRHLLVLDDVDRVLDGRLRQVLAHLNGPSKVVMVSSAPFAVGELGKKARVVTVGALSDGAAFRLLVADASDAVDAKRRADRARLRWVVGKAGGMPFVLRWAAGHLRAGFSLETVLQKLDEASGAPLVDHCLRVSIDALSDAEHDLLLALSLLPQPARPELVGEAVGMRGSALNAALQRLVHLRLVRILRDPEPYAPPGTEPPGPGDRRVGPTYVIRSRLRRYALARLEAERETVRRATAGIVRHMHRYVDTHHRTPAGRQRLEAEVGNVFWAVRQARALGQWARVVDFRNMLHEVLFEAGYWNQVLQIGEWAFEAGDLMGRWKDRAWSALYPIGRVHFYQGEHDEARRWCLRAMRLFRQLPRLVRPAPRYLDPTKTAMESPVRVARVGMASAERNLGRILVEHGELDEARQVFERGLRRAQGARPRDYALEGHLQASLAHLAEVRAGLPDADAQTELREARLRHVAALELYQNPKKPDTVGVASTCNALARLALDAERYGEAERLLARALNALDARPDAIERRSQVLYTQALLAEKRGALALAERQLMDAQELLWQQPLTGKRFDAAGLAGIAAALTRVAARLSAPAVPPA